MASIFLILAAIIFPEFVAPGLAISTPPIQGSLTTPQPWAYPLVLGDKTERDADDDGSVLYAPILRSFEAPAQRWLPGHRGVDFEADRDTLIVSPVDGTITFVGKVFNRRIVTITSNHGFKNSFEPVRSHLGLNTVVKAGDVIGRLDHKESTYNHCPSHTCVHWGVRDSNEEYRNPLFFLHDGKRSILLPYRTN